MTISCSQNHSTTDQFDMEDFMEIHGIPILEEAEILNPQNITAVDSGILLQDYHDPYFLQFYQNSADSEPQQLAVKGNGPNEFVNIRNIYFNPIVSQLFIYDNQQRRAISHKISGKNKVIEVDSSSMVSLSKCKGYEIAPLKDGYVTNGVFSGKPFARLDHDGNVMNTFGSFPVDSVEITDPIAFFLVYQNMIITNPQGTRLVAASYLSDWLSFYDLADGDRLIKEYFTYPPKVTTKQPDKTTTSVVMDDETKSTFTCLAATEEHFYALYDGRTEKELRDNKFESKFILKFNWNGDFVEGYKVNDRLSCFSVTNDDSRILGIVYSDDGEPSIMEYRIK